MEDVRKSISKLVIKLQAQKQLPLWSLANENVIGAVAKNEIITWGHKGNILAKIISIAYSLRISDLVLFCVGAGRAFSLFWKTKKTHPFKAKKSSYKKVFAGFGAASEEYLYDNYLSHTPEQSLRINWVTGKGINELDLPNFFKVLSLVARNSFGHTARLKKTLPEMLPYVKSFLTVAALNVGSYSFYRVYWRRAKSRGVVEITTLAPDMLAIASVDEGLNTVFLQHGLLHLGILIPEVTRIEALTVDEEYYLRSILKNVSVIRQPNNYKSLNALSNRILILTPANLAMLDDSELGQSIKWAKKNGLHIVIRPGPTTSQRNIDLIKQRYAEIELDRVDRTLETSLQHWKPKFVAGWWSTGLVTALELGCLPVSFCDPSSDFPFGHMMYPMKNRVLFWSRDNALLQAAIHSESRHELYLNKLRSYRDQDLC